MVLIAGEPGLGVIEGRGEGAGGAVERGGRRRVRRCWIRRGPAREIYWRGADGDAVFAVINAAAVGEDVDVGALGAKLAVTLRIRLLHVSDCPDARRSDGRTLAKYLQTVSDEAPRSWLKGQALPAWQVPWRKNLHGTCDVSTVGRLSATFLVALARFEGIARWGRAAAVRAALEGTPGARAGAWRDALGGLRGIMGLLAGEPLGMLRLPLRTWRYSDMVRAGIECRVWKRRFAAKRGGAGGERGDMRLLGMTVERGDTRRSILCNLAGAWKLWLLQGRLAGWMDPNALNLVVRAARRGRQTGNDRGQL